MSSFLHDFEDGNGPVPSHIHQPGGGIVADTAKVSHDSYVDKDARVFGNAMVLNKSSIMDSCRVYGTAYVSDGVTLEDSVEVYGTAEVKNGILIFGECKVSVPPKVLLGFDHPIVITDEHIIVGCHCFSKKDWEENAAAIIRVNGYPTKTTRKIHKIITALSLLHFNVFSDEDIDEHMSLE